MDEDEFYVKIESEDLDTANSSPERTMLAAMLQRAVRDLGDNVNSLARKEAIKWFMQPRYVNGEDPGFFFEDVVEELDLCDEYVHLIFERIRYLKTGNPSKTNSGTRFRLCTDDPNNKKHPHTVRYTEKW